jgi:hypothetical protein
MNESNILELCTQVRLVHLPRGMHPAFSLSEVECKNIGHFN